MVSERLINRFEESLTELAEISGSKEKTSIITNLEVIDAAPAGLTDYIIVEDSKDGDYITAVQVPGIVYANGDLVNVLFIEGTEPIAYQHASGSGGVAFAVDRVYESDFGAVALQADADGDIGIGTTTLGTNERLSIVGLTGGVDGGLGVYTGDADGTDIAFLRVYALGKPGSFVNRSGFFMSHDYVAGEAAFQTEAGGTGVVSAMTFETGNNTGQLYLDTNNRVSINDSAKSPGAQLDILQVSVTGAIPVLKVDQLDVSEQCIQFSSNAVDQDINLYTVEVTGTPTVLWDESEDSFSQNKGHIITSGNLLVPDDIVHFGDADTLRSFTDDAIADQAGGVIMLRMTETVQDLVEIGDVGGAGDVDINFNSGQVFIRGSDGEMGVGTNDPRTLLHVLIGGTPGTPAPIGRHAIFLQNTTVAGSFSSMAIVAGNTGQSSVDFGDTDDVDVGRIVYRHADEEFRFNVGAANVFFIDSNGNFGFNHSDYGSGAGVFGIQNAGTNPSANPTGGGILYSDAGAGKWRGSGGTTTTFGPAEPHCPICGRDTALEWENEIEGWYLHICATCLADELGDRLWIQRKRING